MDRRMYRNNMGNQNVRNNYNCNISPYRAYEPMSGNVSGGCMQEERCANDCYDDCFKNKEHCPIGMCYVPWQCFRDLYENEYVALENGNLFKELQFDWYGRSVK